VLSRLIKAVAGPDKASGAGSGAGSIYVCLMGGLGNQLFQYAFARYLAAEGVPVTGFVTNLFGGDGYARQPLAHVLSRIPAVKLSKTELSALEVLADENGFAIRDALLQGRTNVVCRGYWQEAVYAEAITAELVEDLGAFGAQNHGTETGSECVLHVRRHDYGHHGLLPLSYYQDALAHCGWPRFTVVTDEPNFCEYVFASTQGYAGVVRGDTTDPWRDFFLMSKARTQIIANSSFSWWAAWLGRATGATTTVIAPAEWSLLRAANPCPGDWRRIDTRLARP
jgi:hypothetical protein